MRETPEDKLLGYSNPEYDQSAKRLLSKRSVMAYILKGTVPEFRQATLSDIAEKYIEGEVQVSAVPVNPDKTNAVGQKLKGLRNEDGSPTEGWVTFDILFHAVAPVTGERIQLIVNVEAQKTFSRKKLKYILMKRSVYYACRLISSQKESEFSGKDYNGVRKVYTIWICMESPVEKSIINHYHLTEHPVFGKYREPRENYDLVNIVMVYLANGPVRNRMLALLQLLFTETRKSAAEKKKLLQSKYDIDVTSDMEEEMNTMCNLSEGIFEKGMEQKTIEVIRRLWQAGKDLATIKIASGWTEEQIMR
ncbi:MAG: nuclease, partial [Schwartzia sp.]|nr:nuclease [Schwartzia sp. (in: firmicutes)]